MLNTRFFSGLLLSLGLITITGCFSLPSPTPPDPPLSKAEVQALGKCQTAIKKEGAKFINVKLSKFEKCIDQVLELQLALENQLITQAQFDAALVKVRAKCEKNFAAIEKASTRLVDGVIKACEPIQDVLLGPNDPLQFQAFAEAMSGDLFTSVAQLAGWICVAKELTVDVAVGVQVPRLCRLLATLNPDLVGNVEEGVCIPLLPLDDRCDEEGSFPIPGGLRLSR